MIEETLHIVRDPAHLLAEATFITAEAVILTPIIRWFVRRHDARKHANG